MQVQTNPGLRTLKHNRDIAGRLYWEERLDGISSYPYFAIDRGMLEPIVAGEYGQVQTMTDTDLATRLNRIAESAIARHILLLGTLGILINKYSAQPDVVLFTPAMSEQPSQQLLVPVRMRGFDKKIFSEFIQTLGRDLMADSKHAGHPAAHELLLQAGDIPMISMVSDDLQVNKREGADVPELEWRFSLKDALTVSVRYRADKYHNQYVSALVQHYVRLLHNLMADPHLPILQADIFAAAEKNELLYTCNATKTLIPAGETVISLFRQQASQWPDRVAIRFGDEEITYNELDTFSDRVAAYLLQEVAVKTGDLVGVLLERDAWLLGYVYGILKAGAAFVPLDTKQPTQRLDYVIETAKLKLIISRQRYLDVLTFAGKKVAIEKLELPVAGKNSLPDLPQQDMLAYIIFTSGSTGRPKGVMITHGSLLNYAWWAARCYADRARSSFAFYSPVSFDLTITSMFVPLITGNEVIVYGDDDSSALIEKIIADDRSAIIKLTPSHLKIIKDNQRLKNISPTCLHTLVVGGEDFETGLAEAICKQFDDRVRLFNEYGPTEATVGCMIHAYQPADLSHSVPIGVPIDNTQIYILNDNLQPVPFDTIGELYIGGSGVAKGYLGEPALTAGRFLPDPFTAGAVLYKTGDLAVRKHTGHIEFRGRIDDQVKIRGFRIEPAEIAFHLSAHELVRDATVQAMEINGEKNLVAYYVSVSDIDASELARYLGEKLQPYMIPSFFIRMDELPVTANGKLATGLLPLPKPGDDKKHIPPSNAIEEQLVQIWAGILAMPPELISIDRSFFELGGHSIRAIHLSNKLEQVFDIEVGLPVLFDHLTIRLQAGYISTAPKKEVTRLPIAEQREYYPASPAQQRIYYHQLAAAANTGYNIAVAFESAHPLTTDRLQQLLQTLVQRHAALQTSFAVEKDQVVQTLSADTVVQVDIIDQPEAMAFADTFARFVQPFDLSVAPLCRCALVKLPGKNDRLLLDIHHIIADGMAVDILIKEFAKLSAGEQLVAKPGSYIDYSCWLLQRTQALAAQKLFWQSRLDTELPVLQMPVIIDDNDALFRPAYVAVLKLEGTDYRHFKRMVAGSGATDFMLLLSVYYLLLHKISGSDDIVIGTDVEGRVHPGLKNMVGTFVNILPLRMQLDPEERCIDFLERVRTEVLSCYANQEFQFDQMMQLAGDRQGAPLVSTHFSMKNTIDIAADLDQLQFTTVDVQRQLLTQYPLKIEAIETLEEIKIAFIYKSDWYDKATIELIKEHYQTILRSLITDPDVLVGHAG